MSKYIEKRVLSIIKKHYGKQSRFRTRGWEQCGQEIERFIESEQNKFSFLPYKEMCERNEKIRKEIENEYESYFKVGSMYNWINGNNHLQNLIKEWHG